MAEDIDTTTAAVVDNLALSVVPRPKPLVLKRTGYLKSEPAHQNVISILTPELLHGSVTHAQNNCGHESSDLDEKERDDDGSTLFDSLSRQWVKVDNFAFAQSDNHFTKEEKNEDGSSGSLVEAGALMAAEDALKINPGEEEELEEIFEQVRITDRENERLPKIVSPREETTSAISRPLRKISDEIGLMPSRSNPGTPRLNSFGDSSHLAFKKGGTEQARSAIPRFVRNQQKSAKASCSPVQKKVMNQQQPAGAEVPVGSGGRHRGESVRSESNINRHKSRSTTSLNTLKLSNGAKNSRSDGCLNFVGGRREYSHVKSKVREYIAEVKRLPSSKAAHRSFQLSPSRKSFSMSNLAAEGEGEVSSIDRRTSHGGQQSNLSRMKAFISTSHLEDLRITLRKENGHDTSAAADASAVSFDRTRLARLLDNLSDDDPDGGGNDAGDEDLSLGVEEVLMMAWEERKEKQEAKKVLSQMQENYDVLQKKFADAENRIDKLRFGNDSTVNYDPALTLLDSAITDPNSSSLLPSSAIFALPNTTNGFSEAGSIYFHGNERRGTPNGIRSLSTSQFQREATINLREMEDQLYGMELLTDLSSLERRSAIEEMRRAYLALTQHLVLSSSRSTTTSFYDPKYDELVQDIGKKLSQLEMRSELQQQQQHQQQHRLHVLQSQSSSASLPGIDPITKVSNWRNANPSCYGSGSIDADSPAPPKEQNGDDGASYSDCSPPAAEFDSGYPGSDRSGVNRTGRSGSFGLGASGRTATLGNVEEEEVNKCEESDSSLPSEYVLPPPTRGKDVDEVAIKEVVLSNVGVFQFSAYEDPAVKAASDGFACNGADDSLLQPPGGRQHLRGILHSITDLSSDERSMFEKSDTAGGAAQPTASSTPRSPPLSALTTGRQPAALAEQIDQEIVELRNFFDDHREEMLSLIKENSQELFPKRNNKAATVKRPALAMHKDERQAAVVVSGDSSTDIEVERKRIEFARRRQKTRKKYHNLEEVECERETTNGLPAPCKFEPNFLLGSLPKGESAAVVGGGSGGGRGISAFFPPVGRHEDVIEEDEDERRIYASSNGLMSSGGRLVDTADGKVFIPKLNLDNIWTDQSMATRDPRSFDFNQSWPEEYNAAGDQAAAPIASSSGSNLTGHYPVLTALSSPAPLPPPPTLPKPRANVLPPQQVVVVHSSCCRHGGSSHEGSERMATEKTSSSRLSGSGNRKSSGGDVVRSKRKAKDKKELKALLATLEQANAMARNLRDRSHDIVHVLGNELLGGGGALQ